MTSLGRCAIVLLREHQNAAREELQVPAVGFGKFVQFAQRLLLFRRRPGACLQHHHARRRQSYSDAATLRQVADHEGNSGGVSEAR